MDGLLVVDKQEGVTSHDIVARCRRIFPGLRVGHAGTLDPPATGVLLVGLGAVTRLLRFLTVLRKRYLAEIVLGYSTTTLDATGEIVASYDMTHVGLGDVQEAALQLTGVIQQIPPMVSAVRKDGRRLYELARAGREVDRAPRERIVYRFDVRATDELGVFRAEVDCSSGTYVRALADDLGKLLGGGAYLRRLRRLQVGSFTVDEAHTLDSVGPEDVLSPATALRDYPSVSVASSLHRPIKNGCKLTCDDIGIASAYGPLALLGENGELLAVYDCVDQLVLKPVVVLSSRSG